MVYSILKKFNGHNTYGKTLGCLFHLIYFYGLLSVARLIRCINKPEELVRFISSNQPFGWWL